MPMHAPTRKRTLRALIGTLLITSIVAAPMAYAASPEAKPTGPADPKEVEAFADQFFNQPQIKDQLAGAVFVVVKDDQVLLKKGYGYADVEKKTPVNPDTTVFRIASNSKLFTTTAVMQLAEQGKIDLDQDVQKYLDFSIPNKTNQKLTMKHLMTHTTGFDYPDIVSVGNFSQDKDYPLEQFIKANVPTIIRPPGEAYRYDNYAFTLQGYIVQRLSGKPFHQYVEDNIFKPLGMNNSNFLMAPDMRANMATPYNFMKRAIPQYPSIPTDAPEGGMLSTGADMAKFIMAHLNNGKLGDQRILQEKTVETMHQLQHAINPKLPDGAYGFETFGQSHYNNQIVIGKTGDVRGFHSWTWLMPEKKVGGFVIFNRDGNDCLTLFQAFMDHYYPKEEETKTYLKTPKAQLERFAGIYKDLRMPFTHFRATVTGDGELTIDDQQGTHSLRQLEPLLFEDEQGDKAGFKENKDGTIAYLYYNKWDSWAEKGPDRKTLEKLRVVDPKHPYAEFIYDLQQYGLWTETPGDTFRPEESITRGEFVAQLMSITGLAPSKQPSVFSDTAGPYAGIIQSAAELQIVQGTQDDKFEPNRAISRQEAAALVNRMELIISAWKPNQSPPEAVLRGETDAWAVDGVKFIVANNLYGPEIKPNSDGSIDYKSKQPMLRQEAAALLSLFVKHLAFG